MTSRMQSVKLNKGFSSQFYSILTYCNTIWGAASKEALRPLEVVQKRAIRIIDGLLPFVSSQSQTNVKFYGPKIYNELPCDVRKTLEDIQNYQLESQTDTETSHPPSNSITPGYTRESLMSQLCPSPNPPPPNTYTQSGTPRDVLPQPSILYLPFVTVNMLKRIVEYSLRRGVGASASAILTYSKKIWIVFLMSVWIATLSTAQQQKATTLTEPLVEVHLQQGVIAGAQSEAGNGRVFYSFKTIPFAEPPVGDLRFRDPVPAGPWTGIRNGSIATPKGPQLGESVVEGEEDCLYLSVYTPRPYASDLPVMVWIHGGRFANGHGEVFGPLPLLTKDVVLVVIQYRLATLGFLSTEDSELPGNLGLKDQTMALLWVQNNIRDLGGDPGKVNLFGESAGGAAVHFHVLSPMSSGLFRRAILQSGTALCPWALREDHKQIATKVGLMFNCSGADGQQSLNGSALVACLKNVSYQELVSVQKDVVSMKLLRQYHCDDYIIIIMTPRVDGQFLPDFPATMLRKGWYNKVDIILGITKDEAVLASSGERFGARHPTPELSLGFKWAPTLSSSNSYLAITSSPFMKTFKDCRNNVFLPSAPILNYWNHYLHHIFQIHEFWKNMPTKTNQRLYPERFEPIR
ncbi:juvenile hormone esterase-like [Penaeus indicus]|uniref:juvenile hormone esterase-like n=1 Tax=Penaeus indicus TaxID=29960 RepID=UPI00300D0117